MAVGAIVGVELAQIHLLNRLEQKPRQMVLRQPLAQRRRQQERLLTITPDEVLSHHEIVIADPDGAGVCATASWQSDSAAKLITRACFRVVPVLEAHACSRASARLRQSAALRQTEERLLSWEGR